MLYGAAEYSRDLDLAVLATPESLPPLRSALDALGAVVIAVPPFDLDYLERGHAVHFGVPDDSGTPLRVDIMSRMRGVDAFPALWDRRTTVMLPISAGHDIAVEMLALEDLVAAKKTQRDKDWPMIRRLVDAAYVAARDAEMSDAQTAFFLAELRSEVFLHELIARVPVHAAKSPRRVVAEALAGGDVESALAAEQFEAMAADRAYWLPLRRELEALRHQARRQPDRDP